MENTAFIVCPYCGTYTFSGEKGICPKRCAGYSAALKARLESAPKGLDLDDIVLVLPSRRTKRR